MYRIVDKARDSIFFHFSKTRDHQAALACVRGAIRIAGFVLDKINSDGNTANKLAVEIINRELDARKNSASPGFCGTLKPAITYTKVKYCNNILEQDHRRVKRITNPMLGFKEFNAANDSIAGIEAVAMLRKSQSVVSKYKGRKVSIADQINILVA